jgi:hypothetical protein
VKENWSAKAKLDGPAYNEMLRKSKFVPCLGGSSALESYRMYEALEHGAIPFYVPYHGKKDEYELLFSQRPMLCFQSWEQAVLVLPQLAQKEEIMEKQRLASQEWWQQQKQLFAL